MPRVVINPPGEVMTAAVVKEIKEVLQRTVKERCTVSVGLSGGSMPKMICPGLLELTDEEVDWRLVHFFFCDERLVPLDDAESTFCAYQTALFAELTATDKLPTGNVHKIQPHLTAIEAAAAYQDDVFAFFDEAEGYPAFDLILLGIGPDGHTCSLFPNHKLLLVEDLVVAPITDSPKPPASRITLTLPVLNKAKKVIFIVTGANKAEVILKIVEGHKPSPLYPASMVQPLEEKPTWHLDLPAARLLTTAN